MMGWRARLGFLVPQWDRFADAASASHAGTGPWQSGLVQCHGHDVAGLACSPGTPCHPRLWPPAGHSLSGRRVEWDWREEEPLCYALVRLPMPPTL